MTGPRRRSAAPARGQRRGHRHRPDRHLGGAGAARAGRRRSGWPTPTRRRPGWPPTSARARCCPTAGPPGRPGRPRRARHAARGRGAGPGRARRRAAWPAGTPTWPASRSCRWPGPASSAATWPSFVPGHPLSGRERSGPAAARADLFLGRPWVICPLPADRARRPSPRSTGPGPGLRRPAGPACPPPSTTAGSRWSRTRRTWSRRPWPPGWSTRRRRRAGPGRPGPARRDQDRGRGHRPVDADPGGQRGARRARCSPRWRPTSPRRPTRWPGSPRATSEAVKHLAGLLERGRSGGGPDPGQARRARARTTRSSRSSSATGPASWPGCSRRPGEAGINIEDVRHRALAGPAGRRGRAGGPAGGRRAARRGAGGRRLAGSPVASPS